MPARQEAGFSRGMLNRSQVSVLVTLIISLVICYLYLSGEALTLKAFGAIGVVTGLMMLLLKLYDAYLWSKFPCKYLVGKTWQDLNGTWAISLYSEWKEYASDPKLPVIQGYMTIKQTASRLSIQYCTEQTESQSITASFSPSEEALPYLSYIYQGTPHIEHRHTSPIHLGACKLLLHQGDDEEISLDGHYWNDRGATGRMKNAKRISKKHYYGYENIAKLAD